MFETHDNQLDVNIFEVFDINDDEKYKIKFE